MPSFARRPCWGRCRPSIRGCRRPGKPKPRSAATLPRAGRRPARHRNRASVVRPPPLAARRAARQHQPTARRAGRSACRLHEPRGRGPRIAASCWNRPKRTSPRPGPAVPAPRRPASSAGSIAPDAGTGPVGPGRIVIALGGVLAGLLTGFGILFLAVPVCCAGGRAGRCQRPRLDPIRPRQDCQKPKLSVPTPGAVRQMSDGPAAGRQVAEGCVDTEDSQADASACLGKAR